MLEGRRNGEERERKEEYGEMEGGVEGRENGKFWETEEGRKGQTGVRGDGGRDKGERRGGLGGGKEGGRKGEKVEEHGEKEGGVKGGRGGEAQAPTAHLGSPEKELLLSPCSA